MNTEGGDPVEALSRKFATKKDNSGLHRPFILPRLILQSKLSTHQIRQRIQHFLCLLADGGHSQS